MSGTSRGHLRSVPTGASASGSGTGPAATPKRHGAGTSRGGQFTTDQRSEAAVGAGGVDLIGTSETGLTPAGVAIAESAPYGARHVGSRYDGITDTTEVAKRVRSEVKAMQKTGLVPADWKVSVRTSNYAGGSSITINVTGDIPTEPYYRPSYDEWHERPVPEAALAVGRIEAAVESYNYDRSDTMTDYFDVNFYSSVSVNDQSGSRWGSDVCERCVAYRPCGC